MKSREDKDLSMCWVELLRCHAFVRQLPEKSQSMRPGCLPGIEMFESEDENMICAF